MNKKYYDERLFLDAGIAHLEAYFVDGSTPPPDILRRFLTTCEANPGAIAVHCKVSYIPCTSTAFGSDHPQCLGVYLITAPLKVFTLPFGCSSRRVEHLSTVDSRRSSHSSWHMLALLARYTPLAAGSTRNIASYYLMESYHSSRHFRWNETRHILYLRWMSFTAYPHTCHHRHIHVHLYLLFPGTSTCCFSSFFFFLIYFTL